MLLVSRQRNQDSWSIARALKPDAMRDHTGPHAFRSAEPAAGD
jgi:hypothetical protein